MEDAVSRLLGDAGRAKESSRDTRVIAVICTVVYQLVANGFQSSAFQSAVKRPVHKLLAEPHVANDGVTLTVGLPAFMVPVPKFVINEVAKRSLKKAEIDNYRNV